MKAWLRNKTPGLAAFVIYVVVRAIGATLRTQVENEARVDAPGGKIVAGWHGRSMLGALRWRNKGWYVMVSHSNDGEIMARLFKKLGFKIVRGSTGRGGARAAAECIRLLRQGHTLLLSPDGPRGPSHVMGAGTIVMAQRGGVPIVPASFAASKRRLLNNWDRYQVPLPFARSCGYVGEAVHVPSQTTEEEFEDARLLAEAALDAAEANAEGAAGHPPVADISNRGATR